MPTTPLPEQIVRRFLRAQSVSPVETEVANALDSIAKTFEAASTMELTPKEEALLRKRFEDLVDALPPEVSKDLHHMAKLGSLRKASPYFLVAAATAASASAKKHRQGQYREQYESNPVMDLVFDAYLSIEKAVGSLGGWVGKVYDGLLSRLRGSRPKLALSSAAPSAESYFWHNPQAYEARQFAEAGAISNDPQVAGEASSVDHLDTSKKKEISKAKKSPPTPQEIIRDAPGSESFSTLSRFLYKTDQPTPSVPSGEISRPNHPDPEVQEKVMESLAPPPNAPSKRSSMNRLSTTDMNSLLRLSSSLPRGSKTRRAILSGLKVSWGERDPWKRNWMATYAKKNLFMFRTKAMEDLWNNELVGQISDGAWENSSNNSWEFWGNLPTSVGGKTALRAGTDELIRKSFDFAGELYDVIGDRMLKIIQVTEPEATESTLIRYLAEIKSAMLASGKLPISPYGEEKTPVLEEEVLVPTKGAVPLPGPDEQQAFRIKLLHHLSSELGYLVRTPNLAAEAFLYAPLGGRAGQFHYFAVVSETGYGPYMALSAYGKFGKLPKIVVLFKSRDRDSCLEAAKDKAKSKIRSGYDISDLEGIRNSLNVLTGAVRRKFGSYPIKNKPLKGAVDDTGWEVSEKGRAWTTWKREIVSERNPEDLVKEMERNKDFPGWTGVEIHKGWSKPGVPVFVSTWDSSD